MGSPLDSSSVCRHGENGGVSPSALPPWWDARAVIGAVSVVASLHFGRLLAGAPY